MFYNYQEVKSMKKAAYAAAGLILVILVACIAYNKGRSSVQSTTAGNEAKLQQNEASEEVQDVAENETVTEAETTTDVKSNEAKEAVTSEQTEAKDPAAQEDDKEAYDLEYWTEGSQVAQSIRDYVKEVCDENSAAFVPEEDRIATFDMDGTFIGELYPTYFDTCMFVYRALEDETYEADAEMKEFGQKVRDAMDNGTIGEVDMQDLARHFAKAYSGMTMKEFSDFVKAFKKHEPEGFDNLTYETSFYKPMISVIKYLAANNFKVYVVSGTERMTVRALLEDELGDAVPSEQIIGTDFTMYATAQEDTPGIDYTYGKDDNVLMGDELIVKNLKMNKVTAITREIGKAPVVAFGNSTGDFAMAQLALNNEKYEGRAYMLLCDDTERDYGNPEKAASFKEKCEALGFIPVSMKDEFATIYGEEVKLNPSKRPGYTESEEAPDNVIEMPQNETKEEEKKAS